MPGWLSGPAVSLFFAACTFPVDRCPAVNPVLAHEMFELRQTIASFSSICEGSATKEDSPPSEFCSGAYFQGDMDSTLWNGMLCLGGREEWPCEAVRRSQDANGRVWRSPRLARLRDNHGRPTFSRDMAKGALMYLVKTRDAAFGEAWTAYIMRTGALCPDRPLYFSCNLTPAFVSTYNRVADFAGFSPILAPQGPPFAEILGAYDQFLQSTQSSITIGFAREASGFELHLRAADLLIRRGMGEWDHSSEEIAAALSRTMPANLYYEYLDRGGSDTWALKLLALSPRSEPRLRYLWIWEKKDQELDLFTIQNYSMGWDFIFLIDLFFSSCARY